MNSDNKFEEVQEEKPMVLREFPNARTVNMANAKTECHTFKLEVANMQKNISFNEKRPILEAQEHCHWYHSMDGSGRSTKDSNAVGGHYHTITITEEDIGNGQTRLVGESSPPMRNSHSEELMSTDKHTHKVTYHKSEYIALRKTSAAAQQMIANYLREPGV